MPPRPQQYTATIDGAEITQGMVQWAEYRGFHPVSLRRHVKKAGGDMQKAILTIGSKRPSLGRRI